MSCYFQVSFLGAFTKLRKATISFKSICLSFTQHSTRLQLDELWWKFILRCLIVIWRGKKSLFRDKNFRHFIGRPTCKHVYDDISRNYSWGEKNFRSKFYRKSKTAFHVQYVSENCAAYEIVTKNTAESRRPKMIEHTSDMVPERFKLHLNTLTNLGKIA